MIRALSILAAVAALAISATPVASAYTSMGGGKDRGWFHGTSGDGETFVRRGAAKAPRPAGNGIIAVLIGAKAAPPPRSVTDGTSNTVMFGE